MRWLTLLISFLFFSPTVFACTSFVLKANDGSVLVGRSMEFGMDLKSNLRTFNRGQTFSTTNNEGKNSLAWTSKYGYMGADGLDIDTVIDGMNEKGLSFEALYLPGNTEYQTVPSDKTAQGLPYYLLGPWVLGNFATVDEVKAALNSIYVFAAKIPNMGDQTFPLHASIYDTTGKGIVIEFVKGEMKVHDSIGLMTNSPTYDWHITNLKNYLNLSPFNPQPLTVDGITYTVTGQGAGMVGLPGDASPPSRFVKIAFMLNNVYPAQNANDAVNLAVHLLNNVDIPAGLVRSQSEGKVATDVTEWIVIKDLTHKMFYYHTYADSTLRSVDLNKIDFSANATRLLMPMATATPFIMDMTGEFLKTKIPQNTKATGSPS